jgi:hypothetical protein
VKKRVFKKNVKMHISKRTGIQTRDCRTKLSATNCPISLLSRFFLDEHDVTVFSYVAKVNGSPGIVCSFKARDEKAAWEIFLYTKASKSLNLF